MGSLSKSKDFSLKNPPSSLSLSHICPVFTQKLTYTPNISGVKKELKRSNIISSTTKRRIELRWVKFGEIEFCRRKRRERYERIKTRILRRIEKRNPELRK